MSHAIGIAWSVTEEALTRLQHHDATVRRQAIHAIKRIEHSIRDRQKHIRSFCSLVDALEAQYEIPVRTCAVDELELALHQLEREVVQLEEELASSELQMKGIEGQLQTLRDNAVTRRRKQSKRAHQYNRSYHVPLLSKHYQKKYIRARDKNNAVDQQLVLGRASIDSIQTHFYGVVRQLNDKKQLVRSKREEQQAIVTTMDEDKACLAYLREGCLFWRALDEELAENLLEACEAVRYGKPIMDREAFLAMCQTYSERERQGAAKWDHVIARFNCGRCSEAKLGWPNPANDTFTLLCDGCYQHKRATLYLGKKMSQLGGRLGIDKTPSARSTSTIASFMLDTKLQQQPQQQSVL